MRETESEGEGERGIKRGREGRREKTEREEREVAARRFTF